MCSRFSTITTSRSSVSARHRTQSLSLSRSRCRSLARFAHTACVPFSPSPHTHTHTGLRLQDVTSTSLTLQWWFPPANPGSSNAWIGLFKAEGVVWGANGSPYGEVFGGPDFRMLWRGLTKDAGSGQMKFDFTKLHNEKFTDDIYVFTLQSDYGRYCKAASEKFRVVNGCITQVFEGGLCSDHPTIDRKHRQANASLNLLKHIVRAKDTTEDEDKLDERCYFPVTNMDVALPDKYQDDIPLLKRVYAVCDKASFLDWGLTSDYLGPDGGGDDNGANGGKALRERKMVADSATSRQGALMGFSNQYSAGLPSMAQHATRKVNVNGSEGYGEATVGSCHKIGLVLQHLRHLVLQDLHDTHWGLLWDLGPHSTFLDIGSGYGKVVMHLRLVARMRRSVGSEIVSSRDQIAKQALFTLEAEAGTMPVVCKPEAKGSRPGSAAAKEAKEAAKEAVKEAEAAPPSKEAEPAKEAEAAKEAEPVKEAEPAKEAEVGGAAVPADDGCPVPQLPECNSGGGSSSVSVVGDAGSSAGTEEPQALSSPESQGESSAPVWMPNGPFDGVEFECSDATLQPQLAYTHIYIFDWVFAKQTLSDLAKVLQRSPFYVMLSFRKPTEWWSYGLVKIQPVAKLPGFRTTGGEGMTCYFYVNMEKLPAQ